MEWLAIIGLALSAAGTAVQMNAQQKAQKAQDAAKLAELHRQSLNEKKANAIVQQQIQEASASKQQPAVDEFAAKRAADYNRITSQISQPETKTVTRAVSAPVATQTANQNAVAQAWNKIIGGAQSKLGAFQDWGLSRNIEQQRAAQDIDLIGSDARRSAEISAQEQQDAGRSADGQKAFGSLVGLAGQGLGNYAAVGGWGGEPAKTPEPGYGWR